MTLADKNCPLYTKEPDGTIQKWYVWGWTGPMFAVSTVKNAKLRDYKRYYRMSDIGKTIFFIRKEAMMNQTNIEKVKQEYKTYDVCMRELVDTTDITLTEQEKETLIKWAGED